MSPVLTAPVEAPPSPPERPGYLAVAWATFLGYLLTAIVGLIVLLLVVTAAGVPIAPEPGGRGLFLRYDVWSWAAEACVALIVVAVTAFAVGDQLRTRTGWEVGYGTLFLTLLFAGYAPGLAITPLYGATGLVSLVVATLILRWRARPSGAEPRTVLGQLPRPLRRPVAIAVAIAAPATVLYALGYAATHPLSTYDGDAVVYARDAGALERYRLPLANDGRATVTELEIVRVEGSPALQLERAGVPVRSFAWNLERAPEPHEWPLRPLSLAEVRSDGSGRDIELELRQGRTCPLARAALDAVWIRYTVLGMRHEQRIPLVDGPSVRCR